ncbi:tail fiber domain-containing protein, partial [Arthrospira platensis SPKY1]|nr:tail fiber domain-containing protein [Arthrospira platensis SPKY1]
LDRLNRIEITRYTHKDEVAKGSDVQTKVIAQQLREVMPEAVSFTTNFIPDVMQASASQNFDAGQNLLTLTLDKPHQLKAGDRIRCIEENGKELIASILATPNEN